MREQTGIVIFDIDDTMYEYLPCHEHALYSVAEKFQNLYNIDKKEFIKLYKIAREELKSQKLRLKNNIFIILNPQNLLNKLKKLQIMKLENKI